jgi:hypothetical protein
MSPILNAVASRGFLLHAQAERVELTRVSLAERRLTRTKLLAEASLDGCFNLLAQRLAERNRITARRARDCLVGHVDLRSRSRSGSRRVLPRQMRQHALPVGNL